MRFGTALFLVALGLLALPVVASGLASEGIWSKPREQQAVLVKRERLIDNGRTKVIEFVNERTGKVEYCSAGDPRGRVAVTRRGEGEHEFSVSPYEPTTDAELERMGKLTRRDIRTRQTACPREDGSVPSRRAALGSALMRYALTTCDRQSVVAYLEATSSRNKALYKRHGLEETGMIQVGSSPPMWPMVRKPQRT